MRKRDLFNRRGGAGRSHEVMATSGLDLFANIGLVMMLLVGTAPPDLKVKLGRDMASEQAAIEVVVRRDGVFIAGSGPLATDEIAQRIAAYGEQPSVRVRVEPAIGIKEEHAVLAAVMAGGAANVSLTLAGEKTK